jgi:hypothetical protein
MQWNVSDAIQAIAVSWERIIPESTAICYRHAGFVPTQFLQKRITDLRNFKRQFGVQ